MVIILFCAAVEGVGCAVDDEGVGEVVGDVAAGLVDGEFTAATEGVAVAPFWLFGF